LQQLRTTDKETAPRRQKEVISYNMPAYRLSSILVYFTGYANHIGFYPHPALEAFKEENFCL